MPERKSKHSLAKKGKVGRAPFLPPFNEWKEMCHTYLYDTQLIKHFDICKETFYGFLDRQRCLQEQGKKAEYLDAYKEGRNKSRIDAINNLKQLSRTGDVISTIFTAKTFGGLIEQKDFNMIELKKKELDLKTKNYLTSLAEKFQLNVEELQAFTDKHFKSMELD